MPPRRGGAVWAAIGRVGLATVGFAMAVVTSRALAPADRGQLVIYLLWASIGFALARGIATSLARSLGVASRHDRPRGPAEASAGVAGVVILGSLLCLAAPVLLLGDAAARTAAVVFCLSATTSVVSSIAVGRALADGETARWAALHLAPATIGCGTLGIALGLGERQPEVLALVWVTSGLATSLAQSRYLLRGATSPEVKAQLRFALITAFAAAIGFLNYRIDVFLLEVFRGSGEVGVYSVGMAMAEIVWLLGAAFSIAGYGEIGRRTTAEAAAIAANLARMSLAAGVVVGLGITLISPLLVRMVFGDSYAAAGDFVGILMVGSVAFTVLSSMTTFYANGLGRPSFGLIAAGSSAIVTAVVGLLSVPYAGMWGAAAASSAGYLTAAIGSSFVFCRATGLGPRHLWLPTRSDWVGLFTRAASLVCAFRVRRSARTA